MVASSSSGVVEPFDVRKTARFHLREYAKMEKINLSSTVVTKTIETLSTLPPVPRVDNLFHIVMPSGSGKTYLSEKYGFLDIDACSASGAVSYLPLALRVVMETSEEIKSASTAWLTSVRNTTKCMTFTKPTLVLVHDNFTGYMLGSSLAGSVNVEKSAKNRKTLPSDKVRRRLISINEDVFAATTDTPDDVTFKTHQEAEEAVMKLCRKYGIRHSEWKVGTITEQMISEMDMEQVIAACASGMIDQTRVDKMVGFMPGSETHGFGAHINTWAMALSRGFNRDEVSSWPCNFSLDEFKKKCDWTRHRDVVKIINGNARSDADIGRRLVWWEEVGMDCDNKELALAIAVNIGTSDSVRAFGYMVKRYKYIYGQSISEKDRWSISQFCDMYGGATKYVRYDMNSAEEYSMQRLESCAGRKAKGWLSKSHTQIIKDYLMIEHCPERLKHEELGRLMTGWTLGQAMCLFDVVRCTDDADMGLFARSVIADKTSEKITAILSLGVPRISKIMDRSLEGMEKVIDFIYEDGLVNTIGEVYRLADTPRGLIDDIATEHVSQVALDILSCR